MLQVQARTCKGPDGSVMCYRCGKTGPMPRLVRQTCVLEVGGGLKGVDLGHVPGSGSCRVFRGEQKKTKKSTRLSADLLPMCCYTASRTETGTPRSGTPIYWKQPPPGFPIIQKLKSKLTDEEELLFGSRMADVLHNFCNVLHCLDVLKCLLFHK